MTILSSREADVLPHVAAPVRSQQDARQAWVALAVDGSAAVVVALGTLLTTGPLLATGSSMVGLVPVIWLVALGLAGSYRPGGWQRLGPPLRPLVSAFGTCAALIGVPALLVADRIQRRLAAELVLLLVLSAGGRLVTLFLMRRRPPLRVLLVGSPHSVGRTRAKLTSARRGRRRVELVHTELQQPPLIPAQRGSAAEGGDAVALISRLTKAIETHEVDVVVLCPGLGLGDSGVRQLVWALAERHVELLISTEAFGAHSSRTVGLDVDGLNAVAVMHPQLAGPAKFLKSAAERCVAALGVVALAPVLLAIAVAIRCTSPGPALFRQARTGLNGRHFIVYKFRTMRQGSAEQFLELAKQSGQDSMFFKLQSDPRVTRFGSFLRQTSLDELPQLFNVVLGNMALVGPRPLPAEVDQSGPEVSRRLHALPGITGQWQVSGRSSVKAEQAIEHDLDYVDNWRLGLDLTILRRTVRAVLRSDGAF